MANRKAAQPTGDRSSKSPRDRVLKVRFSDEEIRRVRMAAGAADQRVSEFVRTALVKAAAEVIQRSFREL